MAIVSYERTMGPIGKPSFLSNVGVGVATTGGKRSFLITTTVIPALPRFF